MHDGLCASAHGVAFGLSCMHAWLPVCQHRSWHAHLQALMSVHNDMQAVQTTSGPGCTCVWSCGMGGFRGGGTCTLGSLRRTRMPFWSSSGAARRSRRSSWHRAACRVRLCALLLPAHMQGCTCRPALNPKVLFAALLDWPPGSHAYRRLHLVRHAVDLICARRKRRRWSKAWPRDAHDACFRHLLPSLFTFDLQSNAAGNYCCVARTLLALVTIMMTCDILMISVKQVASP